MKSCLLRREAREEKQEFSLKEDKKVKIRKMYGNSCFKMIYETFFKNFLVKKTHNAFGVHHDGKSYKNTWLKE